MPDLKDCNERFYARRTVHACVFSPDENGQPQPSSLPRTVPDRDFSSADRFQRRSSFTQVEDKSQTRKERNDTYETKIIACAGSQALRNNTTGGGNTAVGSAALDFNITGDSNTAAGILALLLNTTGPANTAIGAYSLQNNRSGAFNTAVGFGAGANVSTASHTICIGPNVWGENVSNTCYIGNIFGVTSAGATAVYVNSLGKLGTVVSSRRFKEEIEPMERASEAIYALKPVTFRYKQEIDPARSPQFGLVAEDVEKVSPDLVVRDREGKVNTVRYDQVNAMLLNEFLKEHRKVEEQQAAITELRSTVAQQQKEMEDLTAQLKEQASQIQKVSALVEMSKPAPHVVVNSP